MIRFCGNSKPELVIAERTRSRASRTALSASPTIVNAGSPMRMSASTQTRRQSTPSSANAVTCARLTQNAAFQVVERDEGAVGVEDHADRVEAELRRARPVLRLGQPGHGHAPDLALLALAERVPRRARARAARLDLAEDERLLVGEDEVELAEAGAVVAGDHLVAEALEVLCRELLSAAAELVAGVGGHHRPDARGGGVTDLRVSVATLCRKRVRPGGRLSTMW